MQSLIQHSSLAISNSTLRNKLQEMVNRDHLTNLFARKYLDKYVESSMEIDDRGVFVLIDIDDFKQVNDTYGHQIGDEILKQIASIIQKKVGEKGIGARWGGEELALYFSQMTLEEGMEICKQLLVSIPSQTNPSVTVSIGVSSWQQQDNIRFSAIFFTIQILLYIKRKIKGKISYVLWRYLNFREGDAFSFFQIPCKLNVSVYKRGVRYMNDEKLQKETD